MKEVKKERLFTATVLSNKMDKTAVVLIEKKLNIQSIKNMLLKVVSIKSTMKITYVI